MKITNLLGEATEYDKKQAVEKKKVKSWLKSVSAFANTAGAETPYYYTGDGVTEAYIRIGNESVVADATELKRLVMHGRNSSYDSLISPYNYEDFSFSKLRERYKSWTGNSLTEKSFESFGIRSAQGHLTNAGALLADDSPVRWSRLFCTRWNGLDKSGGQIDALEKNF